MKLPRPRFSLRTLVVFLLLVTSGAGLWWHWEAWYIERMVELQELPDFYFPRAAVSPDGKSVTCAMPNSDIGRAGVWDAASGKRIALSGYPEASFILQSVTYSSDGGQVLLDGYVYDARTRKVAVSCYAWTTTLDEWAEITASELVGRSWDRNDPEGARRAAEEKSIMTWCVSPDGATEVQPNLVKPAVLVFARSRTWPLVEVELEEGFDRLPDVVFTPDGEGIVAVSSSGKVYHLRRRRPEWWWGIFWLWEFWLTVVFAGLFVWSVVRDRRALRGETDGDHE